MTGWYQGHGPVPPGGQASAFLGSSGPWENLGLAAKPTMLSPGASRIGDITTESSGGPRQLSCRDQSHPWCLLVAFMFRPQSHGTPKPRSPPPGTHRVPCRAALLTSCALTCKTRRPHGHQQQTDRR